jgi:hypothetical protein
MNTISSKVKIILNPLYSIWNPIKKIIDIPTIGNANTGICLKQKKPFKATSKKYAIVKQPDL